MARTTRILTLIAFAAGLSLLVFHHTSINIFAQSTNAPLQHIVMEADPGVTVTRVLSDNSQTAPIPLTIGHMVTSEDVINVDSGLSVIILCSDNTVDTIQSESRPPCLSSTQGSRASVFGTITIQGTVRGANDLFVVSPRNSIILEGTPSFILSEAPAPGENYVLELREMSSRRTLWKGPITSQTINYPLVDPLFGADTQTAQRLRYQLLIYVVNSQGNEELLLDPQIDSGFCVVRGDRRDIITQNISRLQSLTYPTRVSNESKRYALAAYYYTQGLYAHARLELLSLLPSPQALFQPLTPTNTRAVNITSSPMYYLLLARTAYAMQIKNEMDAAYARAEELATFFKDDLSLGSINEDLADIMRGSFARIRPDGTPIEIDIYNRYLAAREVYQRLSDLDSVARINYKLENPPQISRTDLCN